MIDLNKAFAEFASDFMNLAESESQLTLFGLMAVTAWNSAGQTEVYRAEEVKVFIERFHCPTFTVHGTVMQTKKKVLELCARKQRLFPEIHQHIAGLKVEDAGNGLQYAVIPVPEG